MLTTPHGATYQVPIKAKEVASDILDILQGKEGGGQGGGGARKRGLMPKSDRPLHSNFRPGGVRINQGKTNKPYEEEEEGEQEVEGYDCPPKENGGGAYNDGGGGGQGEGIGFTTASGSTVQLSEAAMERARAMFRQLEGPVGEGPGLEARLGGRQEGGGEGGGGGGLKGGRGQFKAPSSLTPKPKFKRPFKSPSISISEPYKAPPLAAVQSGRYDGGTSLGGQQVMVDGGTGGFSTGSGKAVKMTMDPQRLAAAARFLGIGHDDEDKGMHEENKENRAG